MFVTIAVTVGVTLLKVGLTYLMSDDPEDADKGPWSGTPQRFRPVDGDPIPVIFGTVDIAPALVWSGEKEVRYDGFYHTVINGPNNTVNDLISRVATVATNELFALPVQWAIASGPVDSIREVHINLDREFPLTLQGEVDPSIKLTLNPVGGGAEEGVSVKWLPITYDVDPDEYSVANSVVATVFPGLQETATTGFDNEIWADVGFRHVTSMAGYIIASQGAYYEDLKLLGASDTFGALRMRVTRIFGRSFGEASWYDAKAESPDNLDMNPVHVIHNVLTDPLWGPTKLDISDLDDASFRAAADLMYDEGVFVSARISATEDARVFLAQMFSVCNAAPYQDPVTGKYHIVVVTDDYSAPALPVFDDSNSSGEMTRQYGQDMTTRMTVKYTKRYIRPTLNPVPALAPDAERSFSQTHAANYDRYGEVELTHDYTEIHDADTASKLATRDLLQTSRPLATLAMTTTWGVNDALDLRPGSPFVWGSDIAGIPANVYRVTTINFGSGSSIEITVEAIEDAFAFHDPLEPDVPETEWEYPGKLPVAAFPRIPFQLPLWLWHQVDLETDAYARIADHKDDGARPYGMAAGRPNADSRDFGLWSDGFTRVERARFTQFLDLTKFVSVLETELEFAGDLNLDMGVDVTPILLIKDELIAVTGWDAATKTATVCRGWLDTVPTYLNIPAGEPVTIIGVLYDFPARFGRLYATDGRLISDESVEIKSLTRTSAGQLSPDDAPTDTLEMGGVSTLFRSLSPLAPTYVRVAENGADLDMTWVVRDRLDSPTCDKPGYSKDPVDFTYTIEVYKTVIYGSLVRTTTNISTYSWTYTSAMQTTDGTTTDDLVFVIWSVDGWGRESWQKYTRDFNR